MPANPMRLGRINEEIMRELSKSIRNIKDPRISSCMLSIVRCEATNDLRWCKVYVSVLGDYDKKKLSEGLKSSAGYLRRELAHVLGLRYTPELTFVVDDSIAHGAHINAVLCSLDIKPEEAQEDDDGDNQ